MKFSIRSILLTLVIGLAASIGIAENPTHREGVWTSAGPFVYNVEELKQWYPVKDSDEAETPRLQMHLYGTYTILNDIPDIGSTGLVFNPKKGKPFLGKLGPRRIRDLHYPLMDSDGSELKGEGGKQMYGVRLIPIVDREGHFDGAWRMDDSYWQTVVEKSTKRGTGTWKKVTGSTLVDQSLRSTYGLAKDDPVFGVLAYTKPNKFVSSLSKIGDFLKTEMSITHMGAYIGEGQTRNAPFTYHDQKWKLWADYDDGSKAGGYPSLLHTMSLEGVDQATLNKNLVISLRLLNEYNQQEYESGVVFPAGDYKFDNLHATTLKEVFAHYRAWLDPEWVNEDFNEKFLPHRMNRLDEKIERMSGNMEGYKAGLRKIMDNMDLVIEDPKANFQLINESYEMDMGVDTLNSDVSGLEEIQTATGRKLKRLKPEVIKYAETVKEEAAELSADAPKRLANLKKDRAALDTAAGKKAFIETMPYITYIKESEQLATYCAEHIYMALNVGANLPQNLKGYKAVFDKKNIQLEPGEKSEGEKLWKLAQAAWASIQTEQQATFNLVSNEYEVDTAFPEVSWFKPLWQRARNPKDPKERQRPYYANPLGTKGTAQTVGKAMVWKPVTTADILFNFVETYLSWQHLGAAKSAITLYNFAPVIKMRMGMDTPQFIAIANSAVARMLIFEAIAEAPLNPEELGAYLKGRMTTIAGIVGEGLKKQLKAKGLSDTEIAAMVEGENGIVSLIVNGKGEQLKGLSWYLANHLPGRPNNNTQGFMAAKMRERAGAEQSGKKEQFNQGLYKIYYEHSKKQLAQLRNIKVEHSLIDQIQLGDATAREYVEKPKNVQFYAPPKTIHAIVLGIYDSNPHIQFKTIGTIVDIEEVDYVKGAEYVTYDPNTAEEVVYEAE